MEARGAGADDAGDRRRRGVKRTDGAQERQARESKEKAHEAERDAKKLEKRNDAASVQSARERYLARKKQKTSEFVSRASNH
eukprot:SAG31_NODE_5080_length_2754_cov_2.367232_2_plen_82_part_00